MTNEAINGFAQLTRKILNVIPDTGLRADEDDYNPLVRRGDPSYCRASYAGHHRVQSFQGDQACRFGPEMDHADDA